MDNIKVRLVDKDGALMDSASPLPIQVLGEDPGGDLVAAQVDADGFLRAVEEYPESQQYQLPITLGTLALTPAALTGTLPSVWVCPELKDKMLLVSVGYNGTSGVASVNLYLEVADASAAPVWYRYLTALTAAALTDDSGLVVTTTGYVAIPIAAGISAYKLRVYAVAADIEADKTLTITVKASGQP